MTTSHFTGFHATASPPPLRHQAFTSLPLFAFLQGELNLVLLLNEALQELGREGRGGALAFRSEGSSLTRRGERPIGFAASLA